MVHRTLVRACLAVACFASGGTIEAAVRVWAVDDGVRIDPQTGKAFEDSPIYPEGLADQARLSRPQLGLRRREEAGRHCRGEERSPGDSTPDRIPDPADERPGDGFRPEGAGAVSRQGERPAAEGVVRRREAAVTRRRDARGFRLPGAGLVSRRPDSARPTGQAGVRHAVRPSRQGQRRARSEGAGDMGGRLHPARPEARHLPGHDPGHGPRRRAAGGRVAARFGWRCSRSRCRTRTTWGSA